MPVRLVAVFALLTSFALAQDASNPPPTEGAAGLEGPFIFSQSDGRSKGCLVILHQDEIGEGLHRVELDESCASQFAFLTSTAGWDLAGESGLTLVQTDKSVLIELQPDAAEPSLYLGTSLLDGRDYYMERISG